MHTRPKGMQPERNNDQDGRGCGSIQIQVGFRRDFYRERRVFEERSPEYHGRYAVAARFEEMASAVKRADDDAKTARRRRRSLWADFFLQ